MKSRLILYLLCVLILIGFGVFSYARFTTQAEFDISAPALPEGTLADRIVVSKTDKTLYLFHDTQILKSYRISMGPNWADGHKQREGDQRTPEGSYIIDWRNPDSIAHLSLHISYPNAADKEAARQAGYSPGGDIMIHGLLNGMGYLGSMHHLADWTDGCIAVTNAEIEEIWKLVPNGTPIDIYASWSPRPVEG